MRGPASGRAQERRRTPEMRSTDFRPHWNKRLRFLQGGRKFVLGLASLRQIGFNKIESKGALIDKRTSTTAESLELAC